MARTRYIPTGYRKVHETPELGIEVWSSVDGRFAIAYSFKRTKCDWHYRFRNLEEMAKRIANHVSNCRAWKERQAKRRTERKTTKRGLEVGDILRASWGYDQTNVDYYQVTALVGKTMVEIREIGAVSEETGFMSGQCAPVPDTFKGAPMRKTAKDGAVKVRSWGVWARKIEPTIVAGSKVYAPAYWSSYA